MGKKIFILILVLFGTIILNTSIGIVYASDIDNDGIEDSFEDLNKRNIDIEFKTNETEVDSVLRNGEQKDSIELKIKYDSGGVNIELSYESELNSDDSNQFEIEFGVNFRELIEFVDQNTNGIYDPSIDNTIQVIELKNFQSIIYTTSDISVDTKMHHLVVNTTDGVFTTHIYLAEEFAFINNILITPVKVKIDIEINNFNFINNNSQIALYTKLESGNNYQEEDDTEDEKEGYATDENGVLTRRNAFSGIFTWKKNAIVDGISENVLTSTIEVDDDDENEQKIYFNYLNGTKIYHDPKIGLAGILKSKPLVPIFLILLIILIGSISTSVLYSVYHYRESIFSSIFTDINRKQDRSKKSTKKYQKDKYKGDLLIKKVINLSNSSITAISEDFMDKLNIFNWEENEKEDFIKEMLSLTPGERQKILNEMIKKSKNNYN